MEGQQTHLCAFERYRGTNATPSILFCKKNLHERRFARS
jgi:hypothetical protein